MGYLEALRILHHFLKDKDYPGTSKDPQMPLSAQNRKWLKSACIEALEALDNPEDWEQGPEINAKGASKGGKSKWSPFEEPAGGKATRAHHQWHQGHQGAPRGGQAGGDEDPPCA